MVMRRKAGQSTLEYILVLSAILLAVLAASPLIKNAIVDNLFPAAEGQINDAATAWRSLQ